MTIAGQLSEDKAKERGIKALGSGRGPTALLKEIAALASKGSIRSEVGRIFSLPEAASAQELSQSGHGEGEYCSSSKGSQNCRMKRMEKLGEYPKESCGG